MLYSSTPKLINAREAIASLYECQPAVLLPRCPWCHQPLDGEVLVSFLNRGVLAVTQTKPIGSHRYTWSHRETGCHVPALDRLPPKIP